MTLVEVPTLKKFKGGTSIINQSLSLVVFFGEDFNAIPKVLVTPKQDMGNIRHWVEGVTTAGFVLRMSFTSTKSFDWIAMEF